MPLPIEERPEYDRDLLRIRENLGDPEYTVARDKARAAPWEAVMNEAIDWLSCPARRKRG